jgi:hypothetical protein
MDTHPPGESASYPLRKMLQSVFKATKSNFHLNVFFLFDSKSAFQCCFRLLSSFGKFADFPTGFMKGEICDINDNRQWHFEIVLSTRRARENFH